MRRSRLVLAALSLAALGAVADVAPADVAGVLGLGRGSGIQVTPDEERTLISKEVDGARWAITRNADDGSVTGNVYFPDGGEPLFLFCEETDQTGDEVTLCARAPTAASPRRAAASPRSARSCCRSSSSRCPRVP